MSKTKFGERQERMSIPTKDEFGNDVTLTYAVVDRGHLGRKVVASARRDSDGAQLIYAEGNDAFRRVLTALGATLLSLIVLASIGVIIFLLVNSPGLI